MKYFRLVAAALAIIVLALVVVAAQTIIIGPSSRFAWDQPKDTLVPTAAAAQSLVYTVHMNGAATGINLTGVTCTGPSTGLSFACDAPMPALTVGTHSATLTAHTAGDANTRGSHTSPPITIMFRIIVSTSGNFRAVPN